MIDKDNIVSSKSHEYLVLLVLFRSVQQNAPGGGKGIAMFQRRNKPDSAPTNEMTESPSEAIMTTTSHMHEDAPQDQCAPFQESTVQGGGSSGISKFANKPRVNHPTTGHFGDATTEEPHHEESSNLIPYMSTMDNNRSPPMAVAPMGGNGGGLDDTSRMVKMDALANAESRQRDTMEITPSTGAPPFLHDMAPHDAQAQGGDGIPEFRRSRNAGAATEPTNNRGDHAATPPFLQHMARNDTHHTGVPPFLQQAASNDAQVQSHTGDELRNRKAAAGTTESTNHHEAAAMTPTEPRSVRNTANDDEDGRAELWCNRKDGANSMPRPDSMPPPKTRMLTKPHHPFMHAPQVKTNKESTDDRFIEQEYLLSSQPRRTSAETTARNTKPSFAEGVQHAANSTKMATLPTPTRNGASGIAATFSAEKQPRSQAPGSFPAGMAGKVDQPLEITTPQVPKNHVDAPLAKTMKGGVLHKQAKSSMPHPGMDSGSWPDQDITMKGLSEQGSAYHTPHPFARQEAHVDGEQPSFDSNKTATTAEQTRKNADSWNEEATPTAEPAAVDAKRISFSPSVAHGLRHENDNPGSSNVVTPAGHFDGAHGKQATTGETKHDGGSVAGDGPDLEALDVYKMFEATSASLLGSDDMVKSLNFDLEDAYEKLNFVHAQILRLTHGICNDIHEIEDCTDLAAGLLDAYEHSTDPRSFH